jgi:hypothetical protein
MFRSTSHHSLDNTQILDLFLMHHCTTPLHTAKTSYDLTTHGRPSLGTADTRRYFQ